MALNIRLNICPSTDCTEYYVYDITGAYDATTNVGGYGGPNPATADLSITELTVTTPDDTEYSWAALVSEHPTTTTTTIIATLTADLIGGDVGDAITDGIYHFTYAMDNDSDPMVGDSTYEENCDFLFTCQVDCCIKEKLLDVNTVDCGCEDSTINELLLAYVMLNAAKESARCGNLTEASNKFDLVQQFCNYTNCRTCP